MLEVIVVTLKQPRRRCLPFAVDSSVEVDVEMVEDCCSEGTDVGGRRWIVVGNELVEVWMLSRSSVDSQ